MVNQRIATYFSDTNRAAAKMAHGLLPLTYALACMLVLAGCGGADSETPSSGTVDTGGDSTQAGGGGAGGVGTGGVGAGSGGAGSGGSDNSSGGLALTGGDANASDSGADAATSAGGALPSIGGCTLFTDDDAWNRDVSKAVVDADATARLQSLVGAANIHPDYGNSGSEHYGIPINVVPASQPFVDVAIDGYSDESDPGPYPFPAPADARIEGGTPEACDGDCHLLVLQQGTCMLYEGYACSYSDRWHCSNEATWDLAKNSYGQRPEGWTSADAAGLAITPGLLRFEEVDAGEVRHAIRFTVHCTRAEHVPPASHHAVPGSCDPSDPNVPPMGLRVRLRADYDLSALSPESQVIARAMQTYGMILADNGSDFYFQGEDNPGWTDAHVEPLKSIPASAFEVVTP